MKVVNDRMLYVRFKHLLKVARGCSKIWGQTRQLSCGEMIGYEPDHICAAFCLMVESKRGGPLALKRAVYGYEICDGKRDQAKARACFDDGNHAHSARSRR